MSRFSNDVSPVASAILRRSGSSLLFSALVRTIATGCAVLFLAGCVAKRSAYDVPELPLPGQYKNASRADIAANEETATSSKEKISPALPSALQDQGYSEWWRAFGSREMAELIDRGLANNPDVKIATLRVAQAKVRADQAQAGKLPTVSGSMMVNRQMPGGSIGIVPPEGGGSSPPQTSYQASIRGSWRADLWGENASVAEVANYQLWQAAFERDNVQRNVAANIASQYVEYVSLNDRLKVARETEKLLTSMLSTVEKRVDAGDATLMDLEQQKAAIFSARAAIPNLEQQREDVGNSIAFLVGTVPGSLKLSEADLDSLQVPAMIPDLPSSLLLRRPDVRAIEARMLAADANIDVARARILPPLDLSAQAGYSSLFLSQLFNPKFLFWNTLASLTASIFDGGKLSGEKEHAKIAHEEMVETYVRTIHQAMREVETALATIRLAHRRLELQEEATASAKKAWDISSEVYAVGGVDFLTLLDTERTYRRYQEEFQRIQSDHYRGYINLFQALGGGVKMGEPLPGGGKRPKVERAALGSAASALPARPFNADGVDWVAGGQTGSLDDPGGLQVEQFWQVELAGLYHRETIGPAWRDLRARYPKEMENRILRPRLNGRIEDSADGQISWYRLYVAKFDSPKAAFDFCSLLQASQQRCRIVSSRSDETVIPETTAAIKETPAQKENGKEANAATKLADAIEAGTAPSPVATTSEDSATPDAASHATVTARAENPVENNRKTDSPEQRDGRRNHVAYSVQLGAFSNLDNAEISRAVWQFKEVDSFISEIADAEGRTWYALRSGVFRQRRDAALLAQELKRKEDAPAVLVPIMVDDEGKPATVTAGEIGSHSRPSAPVIPEPPENTRPAAAKPAESQRAKAAYAVQLGAFSGPENAFVSLSFWRGKGYEVYATEIRDAGGRAWYAIRTGNFGQRREATALAVSLGRKENATAVVVPAALDAKGNPNTIDLEALQPRMIATGAAPVVEEPAKAAVEPARPAAETVRTVTAAPGKPASSGKPAFSIQLGAFASLENAARSLSLWQIKGYEAYVCEFKDARGRAWFAVRTGAFDKRPAASELLQMLKRKGEAQAVLVPAIVNSLGQIVRIDVSQLLGTP